jgi:hypothetical protein
MNGKQRIYYRLAKLGRDHITDGMVPLSWLEPRCLLRVLDARSKLLHRRRLLQQDQASQITKFIWNIPFQAFVMPHPITQVSLIYFSRSFYTEASHVSQSSR